MFFKSYVNQKFKIEANLTENSDLISFDTCFEMNMCEILPKSFKSRNDRVFTKLKLTNYNSVIQKLHCEGDVTFSDLKKHYPTIFDSSVIKKLNSKNFINENYDQLISIAGSVIGKDKSKELLEINKN